ncbi:hypothetical protein AAC387_Pa01g0564 [Persea americana]
MRSSHFKSSIHIMIVTLRRSESGNGREWLRICPRRGNCVTRSLSVHLFGVRNKKKVSIALGLLTSELSEEPWRGNVINFSVNPQLDRIEGKTLQEKVEFIEDMEFDYEIDFLKVFDRILDVAVAAKLEEEKMVKRMLPQFPNSSPMPRREKGVMLLRRFSKDLWNIFLDNDGVVNPEEVTEAAIAEEEYQKLRVFN